MLDENQKPDYSFIMNQPGFEPVPKRRRPKGLMFVMIAVALLGVISVVAVLAQRSTNVKYVASPEQTAQQVSSTYLNNLGQAKYGEAYDLVLPNAESAAITRESFVSTLGPILGGMYDYSTCKVVKTTEAGSTYITNVECNYKGLPLSETLAITTMMSGDATKIVEVRNVNREPQG